MGDRYGPSGAVHIYCRLLSTILQRYEQQVPMSSGDLPHCISWLSPSPCGKQVRQVQIPASLVRKMATKMLKINKMGIKVQRRTAQ